VELVMNSWRPGADHGTLVTSAIAMLIAAGRL
jgi:hypothetical protein